MPVDADLLRAVREAVAATETLAAAAKPRTKTRSFTVADHGNTLRQLEQTVIALTKPSGAVNHILGAISAREQCWRKLRTGADRALLHAFYDLWETVNSGHGKAMLAAVHIEATYRSLDGTLGRYEPLPDRHRPRASAQPAGRSNVVARQARAAADRVAELGESIWPAGGSLDDATEGLIGATSIMRSLATTCRHQVVLIDVAYEAAGTPRNSAMVNDSLVQAYRDLTAAAARLSDATKASPRLARREAALSA